MGVSPIRPGPRTGRRPPALCWRLLSKRLAMLCRDAAVRPNQNNPAPAGGDRLWPRMQAAAGGQGLGYRRRSHPSPRRGDRTPRQLRRSPRGLHGRSAAGPTDDRQLPAGQYTRSAANRCPRCPLLSRNPEWAPLAGRGGRRVHWRRRLAVSAWLITSNDRLPAAAGRVRLTWRHLADSIGVGEVSERPMERGWKPRVPVSSGTGGSNPPLSATPRLTRCAPAD
jgi:hypothetical protein